MISVSIIIPTFNEEKTILKILEKIEKIKSKLDLEIVVVNDGSTDNTKQFLENNPQYFNIVKHLNQNLGKGKAVIEGINLSTKEFIFFQDADLEYEPNDLLKFVEIAEKNSAELVMGSRFTSNTRSILHFWHMLGNKFITVLFNLLNNTTFTDIYCCSCLFKKKNLPASKLKSFGWGQQAEILTYLISNTVKIYECSVSYNARRYEEGKKIRYYHVLEVIYWIIFTRLKTLIK
tara:strand:+ start:686 stop:1384 length:699 start_codon:yes stop_codon:yes gene_type:complete